VIAFSGVTKQYGGQILFVDASFQINPGEKVGLVGPNGAGKTTIFRLVAGEEQPDDGAVERPRKMTLGYFRQDVGDLKGRTILAETCAGAGEVAVLADELAKLTVRLEAAGDDLDEVIARFGEVQARYQDLGGYELEARAQTILHGLGFSDEQVGNDVGTLSGGWKMRVALAQILLAKPDLLLLDEPTNYLDIESILWLETFLRDYESSRRSSRSMAARSARTPATTTSTRRCAYSRPSVARPNTPASKLASRRRTASSSASRPTSRRRPRCRAA
jgi:ATPase subunit of ABC transporter with duplicated ATPase domains